MKYFLHDTSAFDDEKITELYLKFGYEGLGLFYTTLEKIGRQEKPIKTNVLKSQLKVGKRLNKCWLFMEQIGLLSSTNGETFNNELLNFSEKYQIKKQKNKERISQWRKNQEDAKNVTRSESVRNTPKVKESKVKESNSIIERVKEFEIQILSINNEHKILSTIEIKKFLSYWTEYGERAKKFRREKHTSWDTKKRLERWKNNNYGQHKQNNEPVKAEVRDYDQTPDEALEEIKAEQEEARRG